jgi:phosphomannomutase
LTGAAARSVATSHFIDAVAQFYGQEVYETPVGFKYIGEYIRNGKILIGGEESAGLTIAGHVPEKDGILACLLVAEMVAVEGKSLGELLSALYHRVGEFHTSRTNIRLSSNLETGLSHKLASPPSLIDGKKVESVVDVDGAKFIFEDGSWMLFRKSDTEPVMRVYCEAHSVQELKELTAAACTFVQK